MADNTDKLNQFITVTGVDEERARFYMESSAWQLEVSLFCLRTFNDLHLP